jgi:hypothetical protein
VCLKVRFDCLGQGRLRTGGGDVNAFSRMHCDLRFAPAVPSFFAPLCVKITHLREDSELGTQELKKASFLGFRGAFFLISFFLIS